MTTFTKLEKIPFNGYSGSVFKIEPPIALNGVLCCYVTTSFGLESILGDNNFAVFPSDATGKFLSWEAIYSDGEGPDWALELICK